MQETVYQGKSRVADICQNAIMLIFAAVMLALAISSLLWTADNAAAANRMSQRVVLTRDDLTTNLVTTALALFGMGIASHFLQRLGLKRSGIATSAMFAGTALLWLLGVQFGQRADAQSVLTAAQ